MTSRHSLGLGLLVSGFALALGVGCSSSSTESSTTGGGATTTTTTGGQGGGGTTTTTTTGNTGGGNTGTGGGGVGGGGTGGAGGGAGDNHDFSGALPIDVNAQATGGTLVDAATKDFFKFSGTKGQRLTFVARAQGLVDGSTGDDNTIIDTVVTLYNAKQEQIAQDDDAWPRFGRDAQLFTVLPEDGDYYVSVEDCNSALGPNNCAPADGLQSFDYELGIYEVDKLVAPEVNAGAAQDGTPAKAVEVAYAVPQNGSAGDYGVYIVDGGFAKAGETHVFSFTPKADTKVTDGERAHAFFFFQPITSQNGTGSTSNVNAWIVDAKDATIVLGKAQQKNYSDGDNKDNGPLVLNAPVELGKSYYLYVQSDAAQAAPTDFYFAEHYIGSFYYGTAEAAGDNDSSDKAQALETPANATAGYFFVDGDISVAGTDVDWFTFDVPADADQVGFSCSAQREGSGLRDLKATVYGADATTVLATMTEVANLEGGVYQKPATGGGKAFLEVKAGTQDGDVDGTYYRCLVAFTKK